MLTTRLSEQVGWKLIPLTFLLVTYTAESYTEHVSRAQMNYRLSAYHAYLKTQIQINIYYWQEITYPTPRILESPCSSLPLWSFLPHLTYMYTHPFDVWACSLDAHPWGPRVTRPERPKGAEDKVKRLKGPRNWGSRGPWTSSLVIKRTNCGNFQIFEAPMFDIHILKQHPMSLESSGKQLGD